MRKVFALVALSACGDDGGGTKTDGGVMVDAPPIEIDAAPMVDGTWNDTYHTATGPVTASGCITPPSALRVDPTTASVDMYPGTCMPNGTFRILAPGNLGTYYLRVGGVLYETDKRAGIDLSTDRLGRNDIAAITGVTFDLMMTNLQGWTTSDSVVAFSANIGYRQNLSLASPPVANATTLTSTANWNGYKVDSSKLDNVEIYQMGRHTTGGGKDYSSLDRVYAVPSFTMQNNDAVDVTGAFATATAGTASPSINVSSFSQFSTAAAPSVTTRTIQAVAFAQPTTDTLESPPLYTYAEPSDGLTNVGLGTIGFSDPFPASWKRMVKVSAAFSAPYSFNGSNGSLTATATRVLTKATADTTTVVAAMGPPTQLKFEATNAQTATNITTVPLLNWTAPVVGGATDYEIQVYEAKQAGGNVLSFTTVLRMVTKQTSVRIPQGYLLQQRQYVFLVRARNRGTVDVYTTPLRNGDTFSSADALSALVTTN